MAGTLWLSAQILPYTIAVIIALPSRLIATGALHEDGLADFIDGFGGGTTKERILDIMKDSHIGTYGVTGLIFYFLLSCSLLINMDLHLACITILAGDPLCKFIGSQITRFLPYARTAETSKSKTVSNKITTKPLIISAIFGVLPLLLLINYKLWLAVLFPLLTFTVLICLMKGKIQGYTGDCCGAVFLLCELSFYTGIVILAKNFIV
jgi:adenosylcobinamide-GDP ribazoletransferase